MGREMPDQVAEKMNDATWIFVAKTAQLAISAARIEREDRFEVRWRLLGDRKLLGTKAGNADHAHIAVAPVLRRDPLDQIVAVPLARAATLRLTDAARRADDMRVAARDKKLGVAGFHWPRPQRRPGGLWWQRFGEVRTLQILVVDGQGQ